MLFKVQTRLQTGYPMLLQGVDLQLAELTLPACKLLLRGLSSMQLGNGNPRLGHAMLSAADMGNATLKADGACVELFRPLGAQRPPVGFLQQYPAPNVNAAVPYLHLFLLHLLLAVL